MYTSYCLFTLFVFVYVLRCPTHIVLCFLFLRLMYRTLCCQLLWIVYFVLPLRYSGADPGFQVRGGGIKKIAPSEGSRENFGVFRVKNHDFTPKNHIFSNFRGSARWVRPPPLDSPLVFSNTYLLQK